jgi:hypothetical protein
MRETGNMHHNQRTRENAVNDNTNRGNNLRRKKMNACIEGTLVAVLIALGMALAARAAGPAPDLGAADVRDGPERPFLPFEIRVAETVEAPNTRPAYYSDFPSGLAVINGQLWLIGKNGDAPGVTRMKGEDFETLQAQPSGAAGSGRGAQPRGSVMEDPAKGRCQRPYILGGIWYDTAGKRIYAPLHCEYFWTQWPIQRQIHLAASADLGLTWTYEGAIFLHDDPRRTSAPVEARGAESSGTLWDSGHGDHHLFTDGKTGFHYLFSNHYLRGKPGASGEKICSRHQVIRCRIADKMAPDKWRKFCNGTWDEPGAGGKGSYVNGYCVTYNTYLNKYLSFDWGGGVSACDDLEKQNWTPIFKVPGASWGFGDERRHLAWYVADEAKRTGDRTGQSFYVYTGFGMSRVGRGVPVRQRIELGPGKTLAAQGFIASGTVGWEAGGGPSAEPDRAYASRPWLDSADPVEARRTLAARADQVTYAGQWKGGMSDQPGSAVRCAFRAKEIYYRHWAGPDCGRADVYLDGAPVKTLDCWSAQSHNKQFAFVKTGLDPVKDHVLEIRVRGDKHPLSTGTTIRAGTFEYGADCYRASDGFSAVQGKNQWHYRQRKGGRYEDLPTYADAQGWTGEGKCAIGIDHQTPDANEVARTWTAPHDGTVRLQGHVSGRDKMQWDPLVVYVDDDEPKNEGAKAAVPAKPDPQAGIEARILRNGQALWTARVGSTAHDVRVAVKTGDVIAFSTETLAVAGRPEK